MLTTNLNYGSNFAIVPQDRPGVSIKAKQKAERYIRRKGSSDRQHLTEFYQWISAHYGAGGRITDAPIEYMDLFNQARKVLKIKGRITVSYSVLPEHNYPRKRFGGIKPFMKAAAAQPNITETAMFHFAPAASRSSQPSMANSIPSMKGRFHIGGYFNDTVVGQMRAVKAATNMSYQTILERALQSTFDQYLGSGKK